MEALNLRRYTPPGISLITYLFLGCRAFSFSEDPRILTCECIMPTRNKTLVLAKKMKLTAVFQRCVVVAPVAFQVISGKVAQ
jgi:hypothetical protein